MSARPVSAPAPEVVTVTPNPALDWALTVPGFTPHAVNRVAADARTPGGKGVNVAVALAALGHRVAVTGLLGEANAGPFERLFARAGVRDAFVRVPGETRVGVKINDPGTGRTTDVNLPGRAPSPDEVAQVVARTEALAAEGARWVVLGGSLPPGVPATFYRDQVRALAAAGRQVVVDTSGEALRHAVDAGPAVIKPNIHELEALVGRPLPTRGAVLAAARAFVARGVGLVVVSLGEDGALFVGGGGAAVLARPPRVAVQTTVGAGDAMVAGFLAGRLRGLALAEAARLATACALHAITRDGDAAGGDPAAAVEAFRGRVEVAEVA